MKQGELIGDYLISSKPTNANGGKCLWAFAAKDGQEFFIKQFLDPKYPLDSAPGGAASKKLRRQDCAVFEQRHQHVMERLKSDSVGGGNIVVAEAFFRDGATYYKVTKRIDRVQPGEPAVTDRAPESGRSAHPRAEPAAAASHRHRARRPQAGQRAGPETLGSRPLYGQAHRLRRFIPGRPAAQNPQPSVATDTTAPRSGTPTFRRKVALTGPSSPPRSICSRSA